MSNQHLITKVYFPRLVIPLAAVLAGLVDFAIAFTVLIAMMVYYGAVPTATAAALPVFVLLALASALAVGLWLSALNVRYRDVRHTIPFLTQVWLFATPVAYPASVVPGGWQAALWLNPMTAVVEGTRWALLGTPAPPPALLGLSVSLVVVLVAGGLYCFRSMERSFADVV